MWRAKIDRITEEQVKQGLSLQQLADMSQLNYTTVYRIIRKGRTPSDYSIRQMEAALGISDKPVGDPTKEDLRQDPEIRQVLDTYELRILQMRAFYNRLLAERDRLIRILLVYNAVSAAICIAAAYTHKGDINHGLKISQNLRGRAAENDGQQIRDRI